MAVRFTVTDADTTVSFMGPGHAIKMIVAACSKNVTSFGELLDVLRALDDELAQSVRLGLARFDEHNLPDNTQAFEQLMSNVPDDELPPFRVFNSAMRNASLSPGRLGLIVFNLAARRIVQVQNHYAEINRKDRGRIRRSGQPSRMLYHYDLSPEWTLVP